ncbi:MAG: hypothetical protein M9916_01935 [Crocinitomicaceae bacterium]|nr:hypothetical protein [Crocinitomicaceae bacterium]
MKLRAMGFEFYSSNSPEDDADLIYEVYRKGVLEVTVEHSPGKIVIVDISSTDNIKPATLNQLAMLDRIVNQ